MAVAVGGIRLMVPEENLDDARAIIEAATPSQLENESDSFRRNTSMGIFGLIGSFLIVWFPWWNKKRKFKKDGE